MALTEILETLRACLCANLAATSGGSPCFCCVIHSPTPPLGPDGPLSEACKCGVGWVRMVELAPRVAPRQQRKLASGVPCDPETGAVATIEIGILRCTNADTQVKAGDLCTCLERHAANAAEDMLALITTAACCPTGATYERVIPVGNADCAGSSLRLTIPLSLCIDCADSPGESP